MERRKLSIEQKWRIIGAIQDAGQSVAGVAAANNIHYIVIHRLINKFCQTGDVADHPRSGRKRVLTAEQVDFLANQAHAQPLTNTLHCSNVWQMCMV